MIIPILFSITESGAFRETTFNGYQLKFVQGVAQSSHPCFISGSIFFIIKTKRIKRNRETYGFLEFYVILFLMVFLKR